MPVMPCPRCIFWGTPVKRVINHMEVHSIEPDFHVLRVIDGCAASFRRYFAYEKHVLLRSLKNCCATSPM
ncbi:hypothetical protein MRX96_002233 [Rhipicephalus microplus]